MGTISFAKYTVTVSVICFHRFKFLSYFPIRLNDSLIPIVLVLMSLLLRFLFLFCCCCFLAFTSTSYLAGCFVRRCENKFEVLPSRAMTARLQCKQMFFPSLTQKCSHTTDFDLLLETCSLVVSTASSSLLLLLSSWSTRI